MKNNIVKTELNVINNRVSVMRVNNIDYISLTDLARYANPEEPKIPIQTWMRNKDVVAYLGLWESIIMKISKVTNLRPLNISTINTLETDIFRKFYSFKVMISTLLFIILSWLMQFLCFTNLDKKDSKTNFILTNLVCLLIISIHFNFYINPNLNLDSKSIINMPSLYITQNYIYFAFLYLMLIVNEVLVRN